MRRLRTLVQPVEPGQRPGETLGQRADVSVVATQTKKERGMKHLRPRRRDTGPSDTRHYGYAVLLAVALVAVIWGVLKVLGR